MKAKVIKIGNSRGIRIPRAFLEETGLEGEVELNLKGKGIVISRSSPKGKSEAANPEALLSEGALSDWLRPEEDEAWADLQ